MKLKVVGVKIAKVNIIIASTYDIGNESGAAKVSERLAKSLSEKNKVMYVCLGKTFELQKVNRSLSYLKIPSIEVKGVHIPKLSHKTRTQVYDQLTKFKPDVVHAQDVFLNGLLTLNWAKNNNVAYVLTFHYIPNQGLRFLFPNNIINKVADYLITKSYVKRYLKNVDLVMVLSKEIRRSLRKINNDIKIVNIRNGLDLGVYNSLQISPPQKEVNFLYLGSYTTRKNQEFLLHTFSYLPPNYKLILHGNLKTGKKYSKKLKAHILKENINNVYINNFISQNEVYKALQKANFFVSASTKEVQSLVIIEALAAGLPTIALSNETTEVLINNKNGLLMPQKTTPKKFAKKLQVYVNKTTPRYESTAKACRQSVEVFDINNVNKTIIDAYKMAKRIKKNKGHQRVVLEKTFS